MTMNKWNLESIQFKIDSTIKTMITDMSKFNDPKRFPEYAELSSEALLSKKVVAAAKFRAALASGLNEYVTTYDEITSEVDAQLDKERSAFNPLTDQEKILLELKILNLQPKLATMNADDVISLYKKGDPVVQRSLELEAVQPLSAKGEVGKFSRFLEEVQAQRVSNRTVESQTYLKERGQIQSFAKRAVSELKRQGNPVELSSVWLGLSGQSREKQNLIASRIGKMFEG